MHKYQGIGCRLGIYLSSPRVLDRLYQAGVEVMAYQTK